MFVVFVPYESYSSYALYKLHCITQKIELLLKAALFTVALEPFLLARNMTSGMNRQFALANWRFKCTTSAVCAPT